MVEYEDELDLLAVVVTNGEEEEGRAHIRLHDNQNGRLLRTIELAEPWDEVRELLTHLLFKSHVEIHVCSLLFQTYRHELFFDKDTMIHIEQKKTYFCCHVYKLDAGRK